MSNRNGLTVSEVEDLIEELMGGSFLSLTDEEQLEAALAVEWYGEIENSLKVKELASSYADVMLNNNSRYAFPKLKTTVAEYASTKAIADCLGYRYVFDDSKMVVTLQKRKDFYEFTANRVSVRTNEGTTNALSAQAEFQTYIYIPEDYLYEAFECQVEYLDGTGVALLYSASQESVAQDLYDAMLTRGGD